MRVNLTDVEDRTFEALPAGRYVVKVTDYEMRETKTKPENKLPGGTPMVNWEFTIVRNAKTGEETHKNRKLWMNTIIHERVLFNLKSFLKAAGWTEEQLGGEIDFEPDECVGAEMIAVVSVREYNGQDTNDVKRVLPLSAEAVAETSLLP
jgi:Protein of unknown function (DUF669)